MDEVLSIPLCRLKIQLNSANAKTLFRLIDFFGIEKAPCCKVRTAAEGFRFIQLQAQLQQDNALFGTDAAGLLVPEGSLHLADMYFAEQKHTKARLPDAAADGERQLAI